MAEIRSFKGIRYNKNKVALKDVVTQPYDKINPSMQSEYYEKSPYNIVRIILNKEDDRYTVASKRFGEWLQQQVLIQETEPSIYPYFQQFVTPQGETKTRKGFCALLKLEEFSTGIVLPHERTLSGPKEDRLKLLRATRANLEQIFLLYSDRDNAISGLIEKNTQSSPIIDVPETYEQGVVHKVWKISDSAVLNQIINLMKSKTLLIADGHHRYETSLNYKRENPSATHMMVTFVAMEDPGLLILPTHRALYKIDRNKFNTKISDFFTTKEYKSKDEMMKELKGKKHTFGLYDGKFRLVALKDKKLIDTAVEKGRNFEYRNLDVTVLHSLILEQVLGLSKETITRKENIDYLRNLDDGIKGIDAKKYDLFFILNPTKMEEVRDISSKREVMPQKSTDFYPKLISGLVMNKL